jgi:hypothetical protein
MTSYTDWGEITRMADAFLHQGQLHPPNLFLAPPQPAFR